MTTPADLTLTDAARLVAAGDVTADPVVVEALAYVLDGNLWQDGRAWVGPRPTGNSPGDALVNEEIRRGLAAANLARELTERAVAGVVGREPDWDLPGLAEADLEALTAWWDKRGVVALLQDALRRTLCGDAVALRLLTTGDGRPATLAAALDRIAIEVLDSATATVIDDAAAGLLLGCAVFDANARTLDGRLGNAPISRTAEVVYLDGDRTVIRVVSEIGDTGEIRARLGGRLTMHALDDVPPLLGPSLLGIQRQLTLTMTSMGRNTQTAGFVERVMLNAQRPMDTDGVTPLPYRAGAGIVNWLVGVPTDAGVASPQMYVREPADPSAFTATAAALVFHGHKEARQLHALLAGDATPSGESRRQAAADFIASLGPAARAAERLTRWLLETAYAWALDLRGQAPPADLRAQVTMTLSAGVASVEELKETREGVAADLLRRSRYQTAAGVDDPQAEDDAIAEEGAADTAAATAALPQAMQDRALAAVAGEVAPPPAPQTMEAVPQ